MSATRMIVDAPHVRFDLLRKIKTEGKGLPALITKTHRIAADCGIPAPEALKVFPYLLPEWPSAAARVIGHSSVRLHFPVETEHRPAGSCIFMTLSGDVLVDHPSGRAVPLDADDSRVMNLFTAHDLSEAVSYLADIRTQLTSFNLAYGFWRPVRWLLDHISVSSKNFKPFHDNS